MRQTFKSEAEKQAYMQQSQAHDAAVIAAKREVAEEFLLWLEDNKLEQDFVRDVKCLPFKKRPLEYALLHAAANEQNEERACKFVECLLNLAHYQENVGDAVTLPQFGPDEWMALSPLEAAKHMACLDLDKFHEMKDSVYKEQARLARIGSQSLSQNVYLVSRIRRFWDKLRKKGQYSPSFKGTIRFPNAQPYFEIADFSRTRRPRKKK